MDNAGFIFLICPDGRLLREQAAALIEARVSADGGAWERRVYWGDEEPPASFWEHLTLSGLFTARRALVLRRAELLPAAVWKRVSAALAVPMQHCLPVFCLESAWDKGQPKIPAHIAKLKCLAYARERGWICRFPGLDERSLRSFVQKEAGARSLRFAPGALELLCAGLLPDAGAVACELDKLSLTADDGLISAELAAQAAQMPRFNIFRFLRLVQDGKAREAWIDILHARQESETLLFPFLALLLREARLLWQISQGETPWVQRGDMDAKRKLASRLGHEGLARFFHLLFKADLSVKSGERRPEQALEALVADLALLFGAAQALPHTLP